MTIRAQFRLTALACLGLGAAAAGIMLIANCNIDRAMSKNLLADQISKGVYELLMVTHTYLGSMSQGPKEQWERKYDSLRKLIVEARQQRVESRDEHLESIWQNFDRMGELFARIVRSSELNGAASAEDRALRQEVVDRMASRAVARGQAMVQHAFLMIQQSNQELSSVKRSTIILVLVCILLIIAAIFVTFLLLRNRILSEVLVLQRGTERVAAGDLSFRLSLGDSELGQLATSFNKMTLRLAGSERQRESYIRKLAASNRDLEDFAFVASHDLQEPLRKIQAFGDRLRGKYGDELGAGGLDYLMRMRNAAVRMQELIQDLLSYSRVTNRPQPFTLVPLGDVLKDAIGDLAMRIEQTGGRVEVGELPVIESNTNLMQQLFQNLLANSLKFHGAEPPVIRISAHRVEEPAGGPWVVIRVEDNGIGFDEKYRERIFQPFQRLHGRSEYEGTGMGLAICRKIVERHGGSITAQGAPGKGAVFIITLPMEQPKEPAGREKHDA